MRSRIQKNVGRMIFVNVILVIGLIQLVSPAAVRGQELKFPSKPIEIRVPYPAGGLVDVGSRILAEGLSKELKTSIVIINQPGAGGLQCATTFLEARPDGHTLLANSSSGTLGIVQMTKTPPYDPRKDLIPVAYIADTALLVAVPKTSPFKSFQDLLQFAKSNPRNLKGGYNPTGGESHILLLSLIKDTKMQIKLIPYSADLTSALLGGHLDLVVTSLAKFIPFIRSGDVRVLLLSRPVPDLPNIPTGADLNLPDFSLNIWWGIFVHPKTPKVAYDRLVASVKRVVEDPEIAKKLSNTGFIVTYKNPREFSDLINDQWGIYSQIIKENDLKLD